MVAEQTQKSATDTWYCGVQAVDECDAELAVTGASSMPNKNSCLQTT